MYDVIIIGGGPAGLSAALVLGRCRRRVLVCDAGRPRNWWAQEIHGFLTRDGIDPLELLRLGRGEFERYGVEFRSTEVTDATYAPGPLFSATLADGTEVQSRRMLLATGVRDVLPKIDGIEEFYGRGVHHCPYCDGWEHRDEHLIAYGRGKPGLGLALSLLTWSNRITVCTDGARLSPTDRRTLERHSISFRTERIARLEGSGSAIPVSSAATHGRRGGRRLARLLFANGDALDCGALFFNTGQYQRSGLPARLGCDFRPDGSVRTDTRQRTCVPGLYLAGDADKDVQFAIVAAAEGATAAVTINHELQEEDRLEDADPAASRQGSPPGGEKTKDRPQGRAVQWAQQGSNL